MNSNKENNSNFDLYKELSANIRQTDDVSFKLLGLVPIISGAGVFTLLIETNNIDAYLVLLLSIVGFFLTCNLARWEYRNIEACKLFRDAAIELESYFSKEIPRVFTDIKLKRPRVFGFEASKTNAERMIYSLSLVAWLIPIVWSVLRITNS